MNFRLTATLFVLVLALVVGLLVLVLVEPGPGGLGADTLLPELRTVAEKDVDALVLTRTPPAGGADQTLTFARVNGKWTLTQPFPAKVDSFLIDAAVRDLSRLKPTAYGELTDNLTLHGLDKPTYTATLKAGDKSSTVSFGQSALGAKPVVFVTSSAAPQRPLAVLRSDVAALVKDSAASKAGSFNAVAKWLPDFRTRRPLGSDLRDAAGELTAIKLNYGGQALALARKPGEGWVFTAPAGFGEAEEAGDSVAQAPSAPFTGVRPLMTALTSLQVGSADDYLESPGDPAQYGLAPGDASAVRIELTGRSGSEAVVLGKPVEVNGKPTTPAKVYARTEGDGGVMMVTFDRLEALKATVRNPADLRDKDLIPESARGKVDAIDLTVGQTLTRLRKVRVPGEANPQWVVYGGPAPVLAKNAEVEQILGELSKPRVVREVLSAPYDAVFAEKERKATVKAWAGGLAEAKPPEAKLEPGQFPPEPTPAGTPMEFVFVKAEGDSVFVRRTAGGRTADVKVPASLAVAVERPRGELIDPKFSGFTPKAATRLTFTRGDSPFDIERNAAGDWLFVKPDGVKGRKADSEGVANLLAMLAALGGRVVSEDPSSFDLKKLGLDPAAPRLRVTVQVQDAANQQRVYEFGNDAEDGKAIVVRQAGRPYVVQTPRAVYDALATADLRDRTLYDLDPAKVKRLKIRGWADITGAIQTYQFEKKPTGWVALTPPNFPVDPGKVERLAAALARPRVDRYVGDPKLEHHVNIDVNPKAFEFTLESDGAPTVALVFGNKADAGKVFATASTTPGLVSVLDIGGIQALLEKPESLTK
jgi:hypothetical protein